MSNETDKSTTVESNTANNNTQEQLQQTTEANDKDSSKAVKTGSSIVSILILISLGWYLVADRYTPYTNQARVEGYVVGVAPKVSGVITSVSVNNNQEVQEDAVLFEIDRSQYEIALDKAQSDLEQARRQVSAGTAGVESARAKLRAAEANELKAKQDLSRLQRLHDEDPGTISTRRLEISEAALQSASASVRSAKAEIQRAIEQKGGDDDENNAILNTALSLVDKAKLDLSNTTVRASSRGMITDLRADVGQYANTGNPVMTLIAMHDVWISAEFTENNLGHMQPGTSVDIVFDVLPGTIFKGNVRSIGLGISDGQAQPAGSLPAIQNNRDWLRQAQRFPVIIDFDIDQKENLYKQLRIGGQAAVIAYADDSGLLTLLGKLYIRLISWLSYAY